MKRIVATLVTLFVLGSAAGTASANDHRRYGSFGFETRVGFYRSPAGYAPSGGYSGAGYSPSYSPSYSFGYVPSYSPLYSFAPSGGYYGAGASPSYSFNYGPAPQSGIFAPIVGGFAEQLVTKLLDKVLDGKGDAATRDEVAKLRTEVESLRKEVKGINVPRNLDEQLKEIKDKLQEQRTDLEGVKKAIKAKHPDIVFP